MVVTEGGAVANQSCESRPATADEQKFYADARRTSSPSSKTPGTFAPGCSFHGNNRESLAVGMHIVARKWADVHVTLA